MWAAMWGESYESSCGGSWSSSCRAQLTLRRIIAAAAPGGAEGTACVGGRLLCVISCVGAVADESEAACRGSDESRSNKEQGTAHGKSA